LPEAIQADANDDRQVFPPTIDDVRDAEAGLKGFAVKDLGNEEG